MAEFNNSLGLEYLSEIPTLQEVSDAGDTTTTTVHLDGGVLSDSVNEQAIFNPDQIASTNKTTGSGVSIDSIGNVSLSNGIDSSILSSANVKNPNVVLQFPNKISGDYTIATTDDIPPVTGFVPYTGASEDVNLGEFGLLTGNIEFDNTPTNIPTTAGAMYWNDSDGTADLILKGGNVKLQVGQESVIRVVNKTATNINLLEANYQAVRVTGAQGQRLKVDLAQATTDNLSAETIGLVTETINNNQEGFITTSGLVRNINTTGSLQGETWADGDILYLSPTTAGNITKVKPTAPNHLVIVGYVVHAHANQGSIFVKVDNGYELDELHNVKITSAANNNVLAYTSATDIWENKTVETALGFTPENVANKSTSTSLGTSNTLYPTQNAVKVYADTKFTLPSLTSGSVLFSNGTTIAQDNANFFWNNSSVGLCLGGTTLDSNYILQVNGSKGIRISGAAAGFGYNLLRGTESAVFANNGSAGIFASTTTLTFNTGGNERMRVNSSGNVLINTTTDGGYRLDVNGTARVQGALTVSTGGASITGNLSVNSANFISTSRIQSSSSLFSFGNTFLYGAGGQNSVSLASGVCSIFLSDAGWVQSSGTAEFASFRVTGKINQTGTATGITRGLYINPTLTAAADFRAIENSVGKVCLNTTSGNTMIGTTTDVASSKLTVESTTQGFLPPRMTTTQKNAIATPATGLMVYDNTLLNPSVYNGTNWQNVVIPNSAGNIVVTGNIEAPSMSLKGVNLESLMIAYAVALG